METEGGIVPVQVAGLLTRRITLRKGTRVGNLAALNEEVLAMTDGTETSTVLNNQEQSAFEGLRVEFEAMFDWERTTLTETERKSMFSLLWEYRDSFSKGARDVGRADLVEHQIPTADANPVKQAPAGSLMHCGLLWKSKSNQCCGVRLYGRRQALGRRQLYL